MRISMTLLNLFKLEQVPVRVSCRLRTPNTIVFANTHGRCLGLQRIDEPLSIPKGTHKVVFGPLQFNDLFCIQK